MFNETFIYLNKSTTKYIIVGIDPNTYVPNMRFCDRSTGSHLTLNVNQFAHFVQIVNAAITGVYNPNNFAHTDELFAFSGIIFRQIGNRMFKITSSLRPGSVITRTDTLQKFMKVERIILRELISRDGLVYRQALDELKNATHDL
jgi:hypothetical protein